MIALFGGWGTFALAQGEEKKAENPEANSSVPSGLDPALASLLEADTAAPMTANAAQLELPKEDSKENPWVTAIKKAKYKLAIVGYAFTESQRGTILPYSQTDMGVYSMLFADTSVKMFPDTTLKVDFRANFGTETDNYHAENPFDLYSQQEIRPIDFNQLYLQQKIEDFDIILGRQKIDIGMNTLYSPNNRIASYDAHFPDDPQSLGVYQLGVIYYNDNSTTELRYIPFYQDIKIPDVHSRWVMGRGGNIDTMGYQLPATSIPAGFALPEETVTDHADMPNFLVREKLVLGSWDIQGNFYYGYFPLKALYQNTATSLMVTQPRGYMPSASFSTTTGKIAWNGEILFSIPENGEEDAYANFCVGGQYDLNNIFELECVDAVKWIIEYAYDVTLEKQNNDLFPVRTNEARPGRNSFFNYLNVDLDDKRRFYYATIINIQDLNYGNKIGFEYRSSANINFEMYYEWFAGPAKTLFGHWADNDMFGTKLTFMY